MVKVGINGQARISRRAGGAVAVTLLSAALLSGCANTHSITVGSVPDDYRTNHPIVISEKEQVIDIPVGMSTRNMTEQQRTALEGFLEGYDHHAAPPVLVLVPSGSANAAAAYDVSGDFIEVMKRLGIPKSRVYVQPYQVDQPEASAPIRVSYAAMRANVGPCGRWPDDILNDAENKHYADFGCSYQNNLAAQIANPSDLLGPRRPTSIDPENRANALTQYKQRAVVTDFNNNREVNY